MPGTRRHLFRRIAVSALGLVIMAFAIGIATEAVLGTSPMVSIPFVVSIVSPVSLGTANLIFSVILIAMGILIMGKRYRPEYLLQIFTVLFFSFLCDVFAYLLADLNITNYAVQWLAIIASCVILALGINFLVSSNLTMMPPEYLVLFISFRTGTDFGKTKVIVDMVLITTAALISLASTGYLVGVREGTLFAALTLGLFIRVISKGLKRAGFHRWMGREETALAQKE